MENWYDRFKDFMAEYLRSTRPELKVKEVMSIWQEAGDPFSGCETCGYGAQEPSVEIAYVAEDGSKSYVIISGDLARIFGY